MELYEILTSNDVVESVSSNLDYIIELIPELRASIGFDHMHPHHHLDVWEHTLYALSMSENDFEIRLSLLLHDISKPYCFEEYGGVRHYPDHNSVSSYMAHKILNRLGFEDDFAYRICYYISNHDIAIDPRLVENSEEDAIKIYKIQYCDAMAHNPTKLEKRIKYLEDTKRLIKTNKKIRGVI